VRKAFLAIATDLAVSMGSSLAELCQVLILTGAIFDCLRFENSEHLMEFASSVRSNILADEVDAMSSLKETLMSLSRTQSTLVTGRLRNIPRIEGTALVKVRLPPRLANRIDVYAKLTRATRSAMLTRFFDTGLLLYLRSERAFIMAIAEAIHTRDHERASPGTAPVR
jgi:hypothetical protein